MLAALLALTNNSSGRSQQLRQDLCTYMRENSDALVDKEKLEASKQVPVVEWNEKEGRYLELTLDFESYLRRLSNDKCWCDSELEVCTY